MIRVSVFYPHSAEATFDHAYYAAQHMPLVRQRLSPHGLVRCEIDRGLAGGEAGSPPLFMAIGHLILETLEGFQQGIAAHGAEFMADVPNYTNVAPQIQVSEFHAG